MRKFAQLLPLLCFIILFLAWTGTPTDTTVTVEYDEPSTSVDGAALANLQKTTIYWKLDTGSETALDVPASRPQGGGHITKQVTVPVAQNQRKLLTVQATAWNTAESARSSAATLDINRIVVDTLSPAIPSNPRVTNTGSGQPPQTPTDAGSPVIGTPIVGATTTTYPITWAPSLVPPANTPVGQYDYHGGYTNAPVYASTNTPSVNLVVQNRTVVSDAYFCVRGNNQGALSAGQSCMGWSIPARP